MIIIIIDLYSACYKKTNIGAEVNKLRIKITIKPNNWTKIESSLISQMQMVFVSQKNSSQGQRHGRFFKNFILIYFDQHHHLHVRRYGAQKLLEDAGAPTLEIGAWPTH